MVNLRNACFNRCLQRYDGNKTRRNEFNPLFVAGVIEIYNPSEGNLNIEIHHKPPPPPTEFHELCNGNLILRNAFPPFGVCE